MHFTRVVNGEEQEAATIRYELARTTVRGERAFRTVQAVRTPQGSYADTAVFLEAGLRPVSLHSHTPQRRLNLEFRGTHVTGSTSPAEGETEMIDQTMDGPAFDSNIMDIIFGVLPLRPGYSGTLVAFLYESGGAIDVTFDVVGTKTVEADGQQRPAWELSVGYPFGSGRFWVDRETGQPLGGEITAQNGMTTRISR